MSSAIVFTVVFGTYVTAHHLADYWVQSGGQAARKGLPGWQGRKACAAHVLTYHVTLAVFLALVAVVLALPVSPEWALLGLAVSAASHYFADRRSPLAWLAWRVGKGEFYRSGTGLASGAAHLDQAWHIGWLFAAP